MNKRILRTFLIVTFFSFTSCSTDDSPVQPENENENYSDGIFILNEGIWGQGNSSVTFLDSEAEEVAHQIFKNANNGADLGDVGQNIGFYKDHAFVVMNASNSIEVVNRNTFQSVGTIDRDLSNPRYITFSEGKAFVSNWGDLSNPDDDFIAVINADDFTVESTIDVAEGPEKLISGNGKIYVAHTGVYNISDKVSVIDPVKNEIDTEITVGAVPNSLVLHNNYLWVLSGGKPSYLDDESAGSLSKIDLGTNQVVKEIPFSNPTDHPANLDLEGGQFLFTMGNAVYAFTEMVESLPGTPIFEMEGVDYLYGFEADDASIFAASASPDFTSNGKLLVFDLSGNVLNTFETGINPNGIYFNE